MIGLLNNGFRKLLSGYCRIFNKRYNRSGSLFRQKTKAKCVTSEWESGTCVYTADEYSYNCFRYIHDNPLSEGLVDLSSDWKWSSYRFYAGIENDDLCNMELAIKFCSYDP